MLVKFMPKGQCGLDYCLGKHVRGHDAREPRVLIGTPEQAGNLIKSLDFANPFTSVVLSYERKITPAEAHRDIESFESVLMPGMTPGLEYDRVWIEHTETPKDPITRQPIEGEQRTALHCIIPNLHLPTGKRLQPYFDRIDRPRIEAWQELTNVERGYGSAKDPLRAREIALNVNHLPRKVVELKANLESIIEGKINTGEIKSREQLCEWLTTMNFKVERMTKKSISISHQDLKKNLRLEGALYEHGGVERAVEARETEGPLSRRISQDRTGEYRRILSERLERKRAELQERFARRDEESARGFGEDDRSPTAGLGADNRSPTAGVGRGPETTGNHETKNVVTGALGDDGRGFGDGWSHGTRDLGDRVEEHGRGIGGPSGERNHEARGASLAAQGDRGGNPSPKDSDRGATERTDAIGIFAEKPAHLQERGREAVREAETRRSSDSSVVGRNIPSSRGITNGRENPGPDESDPNRTAIIRHAEAAGSAYERVRGLAEAFGRTILRAIKGRFRIRPADREQITRATECVDAYHRNFARGVEQYARRAAETHEEIGRLEAADSAARRIFEDAERTSAAIDQATQHLDGAGQLGRIAAVILARRPLRKLEALRRDYAKTQDKRLVEEAKVWADTQDGPNLTRIPLGVHAQDYVRGDPNITRKELEQQFFENRQAMRELVRQGRLWHEQHPHQEQQQSPKRGRGMGRG